jgi:ABC-2 type transport system ATP-binding protein
MVAVLDVESVFKAYKGVAALTDFDLHIRSGSVHGILGPNGSGKTTALHILTGLLRPDQGRVFIGDEPIESKGSRALLGFAPDDLPLPGSLTGQEYLDFHDAMRSRDDRARAASMAEVLGISEALSKQIAQYSHGMKRKVQVIAALVHRPRLLVLDEPFRGLDPDAASVLRDLIRAFAMGGGAVLIATHDMLRAERDCDTVTVLHSGVTVASGAPAELIRGEAGATTLEDFFLGVTGLSSGRGLRRDTIMTLFNDESSES